MRRPSTQFSACETTSFGKVLGRCIRLTRRNSKFSEERVLFSSFATLLPVSLLPVSLLPVRSSLLRPFGFSYILLFRHIWILLFLPWSSTSLTADAIQFHPDLLDVDIQFGLLRDP